MISHFQVEKITFLSEEKRVLSVPECGATRFHPPSHVQNTLFWMQKKVIFRV
jgi:hypothetical protein